MSCIWSSRNSNIVFFFSSLWIINCAACISITSKTSFIKLNWSTFSSFLYLGFVFTFSISLTHGTCNFELINFICKLDWIQFFKKRSKLIGANIDYPWKRTSVFQKVWVDILKIGLIMYFQCIPNKLVLKYFIPQQNHANDLHPPPPPPYTPYLVLFK